MSDAACPVCNSATPYYSNPIGKPFSAITCPRCGKFNITSEAIYLLGNGWTNRQRANLSGWLHEHQDEVVMTEKLEQLKNISTPSYEERKRKFLRWLEFNSQCLGDQFNVTDDSIRKALHGATYSEDLNELTFLIEAAASEKLIDYATKSSTSGGGVDPNLILLSAKGYDFLSQINKNPDSQIGFCAMWFDSSVSHLWDKAIEPAIGNAGYQPLRIDQKEHVNRIDDEIFADIRRSRFVVADFTHGDKGVRGGVYFEAGFAQGLGLPVIWTCRKDILSEDKLHFDIRQYNFLEWTDDNLDDFKDRLQKRIEAILGHGTWKPST